MITNSKKRVTTSFNNQKGIVSLLVTLLALIGILLISYLVDRTTQTYIVQEVRGIMDASAKNTLLQVLSTDHLKEELFGVSEIAISKNDTATEYTLPEEVQNRLFSLYQTQLNDYIGVNQNILEFQVVRENTRFKLAKGVWGLGSSSTHARPYLILDSTVQIRLTHTQSFDYIETFQSKVFENVDGGTFTVTNIGSPNNGEILIMVRSVSRAVFR